MSVLQGYSRLFSVCGHRKRSWPVYDGFKCYLAFCIYIQAFVLLQKKSQWKRVTTRGDVIDGQKWLPKIWLNIFLHIYFLETPYSLVRRGGRLTSLDASFARCFAFWRTSSKTSTSMFFQKNRQNIASLRKMHDVFHDVLGFGNSMAKVWLFSQKCNPA